MILSNIGKVLWKALSAVVTATSNIAFCAGSLVVGIIVINYLTNKDMARRYSRTAAQQCRFYEVDNIFEYMVETYINGNHSTLRRLYHELNKEARKDFIGFLLVECPPQYHTEILQEIV